MISLAVFLKRSSGGPLKENLSELVFESSGRIFSCIARKRYEDIYCAVIETLLEMKTALCLLNCTHVNHDYFEGLQESFKFKIARTIFRPGNQIMEEQKSIRHYKEFQRTHEELLYLLKSEEIT